MAVSARAGLVGNPSDLYGGAVLAVPVRAFSARVEVVDATATRILGSAEGRPLVEAALARANVDAPLEVRWTTDIPRSVGLAGSSAIVIATLRAVGGRGTVPTDPLALATLALAVERDDLGIVAGIQDRAVQAVGQPVLVDAAGAAPVVTTLHAARPLRVVVAWRDGGAGDSGAYHRKLQAVGGDMRRTMTPLAELARAAAVAFSAGDAAALSELMAASAAARAQVAPLPAAHTVLADAVTRAGLRPNSTGSGGAVAAVVTDDSQLDRLTDEMRVIGAAFVVESYG